MTTSHIQSMTLIQLLNAIDCPLDEVTKNLINEKSIALTHLTLDSRQVKKGSLFFAVQGAKADGRAYVESALQGGAAAVFVETDANTSFRVDWHDDVPVLQFPKLNQALSGIANHFYQNSALTMQLVGITGTNGKTTTSQLVAMWVTLLGHKAAVMGTIGNGIFGKLIPSENTTPSAIDIQANLADYETLGTQVCAMEVSSHGLVQYRVESNHFDAVAFLNLSRDHLDYHGSMAEYEAAKYRLFSELDSVRKIINIDDEVGMKWFKLQPDAIAVSLKFEARKDLVLKDYLFAKSIQYHDKGAEIELVSSFGNAKIESQLLGEFNVTNLLTALAMLLAIGYEFEQLLSVAHKLKPVAGRMEVFAKSDMPTAVVDYAHTPDALEKALVALSIHKTGQLWCVFGCGGDRDKGKRPLMAAIAEQHADKIIVTDDNPRTEDNAAITRDIEQGFLGTNYQVIHDRTEAIQSALSMAKPGDIILIAGKGHEDYQIIGHKKQAYSDRALVQSLYRNQVGLA